MIYELRCGGDLIYLCCYAGGICCACYACGLLGKWERASGWAGEGVLCRLGDGLEVQSVYGSLLWGGVLVSQGGLTA